MGRQTEGHASLRLHRTFGNAVDLPDVVRVARVNAIIGAATGSLAEAAGDLGMANAPVAARLTATASNVKVCGLNSRKWRDTLSDPMPTLIRC